MSPSSATIGSPAGICHAVVVNDNPAQLQVLSGLLSKEGLVVRAFESAENALADMGDKVAPDLIVTDLCMPGIDGWRFCRLLRSPEYAAYNRVPIMAVSATFAGVESASVAADLAANDLIAFPVDEKEFIERVWQLLRGDRTRRLCRILIVDDDAALAGVLRESLISHGYRAETASTGQEAQAKLLSEVYRLVIVNVDQPDHPGELLLETLKPLSTETVVLATTGDSRPELALDWIKRGAAALLRKPVAPECLIDVCASALRERDLLLIEQRFEIRTRELLQREANLLQAQGIAHVGSWSMALDTMRGQMSPEAYRIFGVDPNGLVLTAERLQTWIHPEDRPGMARWVQDCVSHLHPTELECRIVRPDGRVRHLSWRGEVCAEACGVNVCLVGSVQDITERKQEEASRYEALAHFHGFAEASQYGMGIASADARVTYVNPALARLLGEKSANDCLGKHFPTAYFTESIAQRIRDEVMPALMRDGRWHGEMEVRAVDGRSVPTDVNSFVINGGPGHPHSLAIIITDITERKRAQADLEHSQERLRAVVAATPSCIKLVARDGTLLEMNEYGLRMVEADCASAVVGNNMYSLIAPEHRESFIRFNEHICDGHNGSLQFELIGLHGTRRWMETYAVPLRDPVSKQTLHLAITMDATERKRAEETLLQGKQRLELAHRAAGAGTWDWDVTSQRLQWSPELFRMFALEPGRSEATFETWRLILHPDDRESASMKIEQAIRDRTPLNSDYRVVHPGGEVRWINALGNTIYDSGGKPLRMIGLCIDITQRKQVDEKLKESEQNYREIFNSVTDAIFIHDTNTGLIVDVNDTMLKIYGYTDREEVINLHPNDIGYGKSPYGYDEAAEWMRKAIVDGPQLFEWCAHTKAGQSLWVQVALRSTTLNGQPRVLAVVRDATERKKAEETLRQYKMAIEQSSDGIVITDLEGRLVFANHSWSRMHGYTPDELIGQHLAVGHAPGRIHQEVQPFNRTVLDSGQHHGEVGRVRKDGTTFPTWMSTTPLKDEKGILVGLLRIARDMTEHKRAETERAKLQEQLAQAQKMESVGRLAGGVAHDFNNMLGAILINVNLALREVPREGALRENLQEVEKCAKRSADLTRQLLAFARKQTITPQILNLNAIVDGMLKMLRRLIGEGIDLTWFPANDLWPIKIDPSQIDQILANLCVNARDAVGEVGKVTLKTANVPSGEVRSAVQSGPAVGDYVCLSVSDNGCGMDKDTLSHLFEPFFTTKGVGLGTGLGLATVYGIVQQNEGFIDVRSELSQGTTFEIYLPRHRAKVSLIPDGDADHSVSRGHETILMVEDEPALLRGSRRALEGLGYTVLCASTPGEAIRLAEEYSGRIHLLVTDVVMPEMNGRDLAKRLVSINPSLKRLFMSGYTADVIAHHGVLEAGIHFLQKPFTIAALADKVRETLS